MVHRLCTLPLLTLLATLFLSGCNNTLNPLCTSARPAPVIGSLSPSTVTFGQVQQGVEITVNGSNFVSSSEIKINSTPLAAKVLSSQQMKVMISTDVISSAGPVKVAVLTPAGNSANVGCTSGGTSTALTLTISQ
jgi:hypothetical protein